VIVVDTNVLSEPLGPTPSPAVLAWLSDAAADVAITTVTVAELLYRVQRLPEGRRKVDLTAAIERLIRSAGDRVLAYDEAAARAHASLRAAREAAGRVTSVEDGMVAAIAIAHGAKVATRNVTDFEGFGVEVVNPWESVR
jgi:predicted nucleic acid-binding protein